jgi:hypothetical protein
MRHPVKQNWLGRALRGLVRCERGDTNVTSNILLTALGIFAVHSMIDPTKQGMGKLGNAVQDQAEVVRNGATSGSTSGLGGGGSGMDFGSAMSGIGSALSTVTDFVTQVEQRVEQQAEKQQAEKKENQDQGKNPNTGAVKK